MDPVNVLPAFLFVIDGLVFGLSWWLAHIIFKRRSRVLLIGLMGGFGYSWVCDLVQLATEPDWFWFNSYSRAVFFRLPILVSLAYISWQLHCQRFERRRLDV